MQQHIGAPAKPVVQVGDEVAEGQPVGEAGGFVSVPIHTPIAGRVVAVENRPHPGGFSALSVVVEAPVQDGGATGDDAVSAPTPWRIADPVGPDYMEADPKRLREIIRQAGVVGLGGAAFPTHVKLSPPPNKPVDLLIINGAECEPYLTCDHRIMLEETDLIVHGVRILRHVLGIERAIIGIEDNKPDAVKVLREAFSQDRGVEVRTCQVKYPQGGEKQLIKALSGREVPPPPGLPMDVGVVVQNVSTAAAVARAVMDGVPLTDRVVTITGSLVKTPANLRVKLGTPLNQLIEACDGLTGDPARVVMGGPMMGTALVDLDIPVVKATSGFLFFSRSDLPRISASPCIRCGRCVSACPHGLLPSEIARRVEQGDLEGALEMNLKECMECGSCSYICPSNRWLVQLFRIGKARLNERKS